jgi:hypothetical protein
MLAHPYLCTLSLLLAYPMQVHCFFFLIHTRDSLDLDVWQLYQDV